VKLKVGDKIGKFEILEELEPTKRRNHIIYHNYKCKCTKCKGTRIMGEFSLQYLAFLSCDACEPCEDKSLYG
jgi:hypothetical protein